MVGKALQCPWLQLRHLESGANSNNLADGYFTIPSCHLSTYSSTVPLLQSPSIQSCSIPHEKALRFLDSAKVQAARTCRQGSKATKALCSFPTYLGVQKAASTPQTCLKTPGISRGRSQVGRTRLFTFKFTCSQFPNLMEA